METSDWRYLAQMDIDMIFFYFNVAIDSVYQSISFFPSLIPDQFWLNWLQLSAGCSNSLSSSKWRKWKDEMREYLLSI